MINELNALLQEMCEKLNSPSLNYCVNIKFFDASGMAGKGIEEIVKQALPSSNIEVGSTYSLSMSDVINELSSVFDDDYTAAIGSYPNLNYVSSSEFKNLKKKIIDRLTVLLSNSEQIIGFWLKEGHPYYPVFWDYAYITEYGSDAHVFIGSISD